MLILTFCNKLDSFVGLYHDPNTSGDPLGVSGQQWVFCSHIVLVGVLLCISCSGLSCYSMLSLAPLYYAIIYSLFLALGPRILLVFL
jgi:hypothetical protein